MRDDGHIQGKNYKINSDMRFIFLFSLVSPPPPNARDQSHGLVHTRQAFSHPPISPAQVFRCVPVGIFLKQLQKESIKKTLGSQRTFPILYKLKQVLKHSPNGPFCSPLPILSDILSNKVLKFLVDQNNGKNNLDRVPWLVPIFSP